MSKKHINTKSLEYAKNEYTKVKGMIKESIIQKIGEGKDVNIDKIVSELMSEEISISVNGTEICIDDNGEISLNSDSNIEEPQEISSNLENDSDEDEIQIIDDKEDELTEEEEVAPEEPVVEPVAEEPIAEPTVEEPTIEEPTAEQPVEPATEVETEITNPFDILTKQLQAIDAKISKLEGLKSTDDSEEQGVEVIEDEPAAASPAPEEQPQEEQPIQEDEDDLIEIDLNSLTEMFDDEEEIEIPEDEFGSHQNFGLNKKDATNPNMDEPYLEEEISFEDEDELDINPEIGNIDFDMNNPY